jgi:hypothetical protein
VPTHALPTEASGPTPSKKSANVAPNSTTAAENTAASGPTSAAAPETTTAKTNAAREFGIEALEGGILAAVVLGGLALL